MEPSKHLHGAVSTAFLPTDIWCQFSELEMNFLIFICKALLAGTKNIQDSEHSKGGSLPSFMWMRCRAWREDICIVSNRALPPPAPATYRVASSICLEMIQWSSGQIEFPSPEEDHLAPLFPVLFYKWKVWLWNPSWVSCRWWVWAWPQGAGAPGMADKAFWWSVPLLFPNWLPGLVCFSCTTSVM